MIILKLGGSLITDKSKKFVIREEVVARVAKEIVESGVTKKGLMIVHGGGSFGHPLAKEYGLDKGITNPSQLKGVALTRVAMTKLNLYTVEALVNESIPAVAVQTSAIAMNKSRRIETFDLGFINWLLSSNMVPVIYGDVVADSEQEYSILSGDQIVSYLTKQFEPERIILATDVDGVFDKDPKRDSESKEKAKHISFLSNRELASIDFGDKNDVTGGIKGKLIELLELAEEGYESVIINAHRNGRLRKALSGIEVKGTRVGVYR